MAGAQMIRLKDFKTYGDQAPVQTVIESLDSATYNTSIKRTVAVLDFKVAETLVLPSLEIENHFAGQVTDALMSGGRVSVLKRTEIDEAMKKRKLVFEGGKKASLTLKERQLMMIPAHILARGTLIEIKVEEMEDAPGFKRSDFDKNIKPNLKAQAVFEIELINNLTGKTFSKTEIHGHAAERGGRIDIKHLIKLDKEMMSQFPLGKAIQNAITQVAKFISEKARDVSWQGVVMSVDHNSVVINAGSQHGAHIGQILHVYRKGDELFDPTTQSYLGHDYKLIGVIRVMEVSDQFSKAGIVSSTRSIETDDTVKEN